MCKTHIDRCAEAHLHTCTHTQTNTHTRSVWRRCQLGVMVISETGGAANEQCEWEERLQLNPLIALKAFHTIYPVNRDGAAAGVCVCVCECARTCVCHCV